MANDLLSSVQQESLEIGGSIDPYHAKWMPGNILLDPDFDESIQ